MKYHFRLDCGITALSPSMRREWIEMHCFLLVCVASNSLPPCGGSGLKCLEHCGYYLENMSPSMRREWIEMITFPVIQLLPIFVSLHAEGVD